MRFAIDTILPSRLSLQNRWIIFSDRWAKLTNKPIIIIRQPYEFFMSPEDAPEKEIKRFYNKSFDLSIYYAGIIKRT